MNYCIDLIKSIYLPADGLHSIKALPLMPFGQEHIGTWFMTSQMAFSPQVPIHGLTHLFRKHPLSSGQSVLYTHSGRQPR